jgi:hypothetical protein
MMQAQQQRSQRNRLLAGITVIVASAMLAIILLMNSSSGAVSNQNATSTARGDLEFTATVGQGVAQAVFPTAVGAGEVTWNLPLRRWRQILRQRLRLLPTSTAEPSATVGWRYCRTLIRRGDACIVRNR